jgi:hypothetical protein
MTRDEDKETWAFLARAPKMVIPPPEPCVSGVCSIDQLKEDGAKYLAEQAREAELRSRHNPIDAFLTKIENGLMAMFAPLLRAIPIILILAFLIGVCHIHPIIALLVACGIGPFDLLRSAGLIGPKKRDKEGKEIDDPF